MQFSARLICDSLTAVIENSCHADRRFSHLGDCSHASRRGGSLDAPDHKSYPFARQGGQTVWYDAIVYAVPLPGNPVVQLVPVSPGRWPRFWGNDLYPRQDKNI